MHRSLLTLYKFGPKPVPYREALKLQEELTGLRRQLRIGDSVLVLQHPPVYTLGKRGTESHFKLPREVLQRKGFDIVNIARGGETTYHGPGQLVVYPILNLRESSLGPRAYVESLEDIVSQTLEQYDVSARGRVPGRTGVWVEDRKICAIGVKISQGITSHGLALNVSMDLSPYQHIVPCGIPDKKMTSLAQETGRTALTCDEVTGPLVSTLMKVFRYEEVCEVNGQQHLLCSHQL